MPERPIKNEIEYLQSTKLSLVKGDVIIYHPVYHYRPANEIEIKIFDGLEIINITWKNVVPNMLYEVINNDVPIDYWKWHHKSIVTEHRLKYLDQVMFDISIVRDQCINNIDYGVIETNMYGLYTYFEYDYITYYIIYDNLDDVKTEDNYQYIKEQDKIKQMHDFKIALSSGGTMVFRTSSIYYDFDENVLYLLGCR